MNRVAAGFLMTVLLMVSSAAYAKPKVSVKLHIEEEITNLSSSGDLSSLAGSGSSAVTYLNVTVLPDTPTGNLKNDGKWCLKSQSGEAVHLEKGGEYPALMDGDFFAVEIPQPKGKPLKLTFMVFDHKWRSRLDIR